MRDEAQGQDLLVRVGERIAGLRRERGWSQQELARRLGVTRERLSNWEVGLHAPALEDLLALGKALGVSCDDLLKGTDPQRQGEAATLSPAEHAALAHHLSAAIRLAKVPVGGSGRKA